MSTPLATPDSLVQAPSTRPLIVLGAPGSGKTTLLTERMRWLVSEGMSPDRIRLLTPTRRQATALRDGLAQSLGVATRGAVSMSVAAFAFWLVRADAEDQKLAPPRLRSGADVDSDIRDLLAEQGSSGAGPSWPEFLGPAVVQTEAFRTELRELIARVTEWGLDSSWLRDHSHLHPAWAAVADFLDDYERVIARSRPQEFDSPELLRVATSLVQGGLADRVGLGAVLFDDAHDLSPAATALIEALHQRGVHVSVTAEPDVAGQSFRGADPEGPSWVAEALGVSPVVLDTVFRHGPALREMVTSITGRIGTARAGTQRQAAGGGQDGAVPALCLRASSPGAEADDIARLLLARHLESGVPFSDMAVAVRRAAQIPLVTQSLEQAGISAMTDYRSALAEHPATRELMGWVIAARAPEWLTAERVRDLLTGVYARMDVKRVRRLGSVLRLIDQQRGISRSGLDAVVECVRDADIPPELPQSFHAPLERVLGVVDTLRELPPEATPAVVMSAAWNAWGVEKEWLRLAGGSSEQSGFARESLQQVSALLASADRFSETHPGVTVEGMCQQILDNEISEDVVLPVSRRQGVLVATPSQLAGIEVDTVVVAGLNDHVWPNTRIRWSLLGSPLVARSVRGGELEDIDEYRAVLDDELRMAALAVSRARAQVIVSAVDSDDTQPSPLFTLLAQHATEAPAQGRVHTSSRELVAALRRDAQSGSAGSPGSSASSDSAAAAAGLRYLTERGVAEANPSSWWGLQEVSSEAPLFDTSEPSVSPSRIDAIEQSPLDWFLDTVSPDEPGVQLSRGLLVHWAAEQQPEGTSSTLWSLVESRWGEMDFESEWVSRREKVTVRGFVDALADYLSDRRAEDVSLGAVEAFVDTSVDGVRLRGKLDRIEKTRDGHLVVIDIKTGQAVTNQKEIDQNPQLQAYQVALADSTVREQLGVDGESGGAWLVFVSGGIGGKNYRVAEQSPLGEDGLEVARERLRAVAQSMSQAQFEGPVYQPVGNKSYSRHRWQRVGSTCG